MTVFCGSNRFHENVSVMCLANGLPLFCCLGKFEFCTFQGRECQGNRRKVFLTKLKQLHPNSCVTLGLCLLANQQTGVFMKCLDAYSQGRFFL